MVDSPLSLGGFNPAAGIAGAADLAMVLGSGKSPLPSEFSVLENTYAPIEFSEGSALFGQGQTLAGQGTAALNLAQQGKLTGPQAAQLALDKAGWQNQAAQMYYGMGRDPTKDTSFLGQRQAIDMRAQAEAQSFIQSTIALGGAELSAGAAFTGQAINLQTAANNAVTTVGQAQMKNNEDYSNALTAAFTEIGQTFGSTKKT